MLFFFFTNRTWMWWKPSASNTLRNLKENDERCFVSIQLWRRSCSFRIPFHFLRWKNLEWYPTHMFEWVIFSIYYPYYYHHFPEKNLGKICQNVNKFFGNLISSIFPLQISKLITSSGNCTLFYFSFKVKMILLRLIFTGIWSFQKMVQDLF